MLYVVSVTIFVLKISNFYGRRSVAGLCDTCEQMTMHFKQTYVPIKKNLQFDEKYYVFVDEKTNNSFTKENFISKKVYAKTRFFSSSKRKTYGVFCFIFFINGPKNDKEYENICWLWFEWSWSLITVFNLISFYIFSIRHYSNIILIKIFILSFLQPFSPLNVLWM